jgi:hypothetical protein
MNGQMQSAAGVVALQGSLRLADADAVSARVLAGLAEGDVIVDITDVDGFDASIMQVLLAAQVSARRMSRRLWVDLLPDSPPALLLDQLCLTEALDLIARPDPFAPLNDDLKETD